MASVSRDPRMTSGPRESTKPQTTMARMEGIATVIPNSSPSQKCGFLPAQDVPAMASAFVNADRMLQEGKFVREIFGHGLEAALAVLALIGLVDDSLQRLDDDLNLVSADLVGLERAAAVQVGSDLPQHAVRLDRRQESHDELTNRAHGPGRDHIAPRFAENCRVVGLHHDGIVKIIHLTLRQPVSLVLHFIGGDAGVQVELLDIDIGPGILEIVQEGADDPAVV